MMYDKREPAERLPQLVARKDPGFDFMSRITGFNNYRQRALTRCLRKTASSRGEGRRRIFCIM